MRITRDEQMMLHALVTSLRSTCGRKAVGAIIAKDGRIISSGYAGQPGGFAHCTPACLAASNVNGGCQRTIHAEQNAIAYAARHGISTQGATLYCTDSPCKNCAMQIINTGIIAVKYLRPYRDTTGVEILKHAGITCEIQIVNSVHYMNLHQLSVCGGTGLPLSQE